MVSTVVDVLFGIVVVLAVTVLTGYFVAQEFGYMAVDRSSLRARASSGDARARRALGITSRTSFMLSGAQLGITVTGLVVGYVAEPMIGEGLGELLGVAGVPAGIGVAAGTILALLLATVVQMVFGELFPKNLAIARPEPVARWLALSTAGYLKLFGWIIRIFDAASNRLLRAMDIEPVHDVEHAATTRDLEAIIGESRASGDLPPDLSTLLDRVLDFDDRPARSAMIPRPRVATVSAATPLAELVPLMGSGHSRYPVIGESIDDVVGVVYLRDVLRLTPVDLDGRTVADLARRPVLLPDTLPLPEVLEQLREAEEEFGCVLDEYGGLAGIITVEDIAEELVGEITDEHDPAAVEQGGATRAGCYVVDGSMHIDEVERLLDQDLPRGPYHTIGGLVMTELGRLPEPGDVLLLAVPAPPDAQVAGLRRKLEITVRTVKRRVPERVELTWTSFPAHEVDGRQG